MGKISKFFVSWLMPKNVHTGKIKLSQRNLEGGHQWPFNESKQRYPWELHVI
jgi:hypothetical protein